MEKTPLDELLGVPAGAAEVLIDVIGGTSASKAIENQEKQGQKLACQAKSLPIYGTSGDSRPMWEELGFVFGEPIDKLFVNATMPPGWEMQPTEHPLWSNLLDEQGRIRGMMMYKAASYDRDARIELLTRFTVNQYDKKKDDPANLIRVSVYDKMHKEPVHIIEYKCEDEQERYRKRDELEKEAKAWLGETYPDWKNPIAYW